MDDESKDYNTRAMKTILNGLPSSIKANLEKSSLAKDIWINSMTFTQKEH